MPDPPESSPCHRTQKKRWRRTGLSGRTSETGGSVSVGAGVFVGVGGTGVLVAVGGTGVFVAVGGTGVFVAVGGGGVRVGVSVHVGVGIGDSCA
jgi:hypothetical protein